MSSAHPGRACVEYSSTGRDRRRHAGPLEVGPELVPGGQPAEQPALDERVDGHDLAARRARHQAEQDRGPALVAADLQQSRPGARGRRLVEQQPALVPGQPSRHGIGQQPRRRRSRGLGGAAGSAAVIVARHGRRSAVAPWLHSRAAQYRVEGVSHRHTGGDRDRRSPGRGPASRGPGVAWRIRGRVTPAGWVRRPHLRLAGRDVVPPAARPDDVRHEVRPEADVERFLVQSLSLWKQDSNFGELQNQAYGYLFPQGASSCWASGSASPDWVVQRAWTAVLLLVVAFEGARRLWLALRPTPSPWTAWLAGIAFAVSPRLLGLVGRAERRGAADGRAALGGAARSCWRSRVGSGCGPAPSGRAWRCCSPAASTPSRTSRPCPCRSSWCSSTLGRPGDGAWSRWWLGATVARERVVDAAAAGPRPVQPAVPGLHRDLRGRRAPAGLDERGARRRPLGLLRLRRRGPVVARLLRAVHGAAPHRGDRCRRRRWACGA